MKMTGEQRIDAPRQQVWDALNDPTVLRQCIPGCQSLEKEADDRLRAIAEIKIGPIGARFQGAITLSELDPPSGYTITGEGQGGTVGHAKGGAKVRLEDAAGGGTLLAYDVDVTVGGRLAQLGGPIIDATAKQMAGQFFKKFGGVVAGGGETAAVSASAEPQPLASVAPVSTPIKAAPPTPVAWILAVALAALVGFLVGRAQPGAQGSDWQGLAIGLLLIVVAGAGFAWGQRGAR